MTVILLILIYIVFISLGLPDSVIGTSWPAISQSLGVNESFQGIVTSTVSICTIISSFFSTIIIKKIKTGPTVCISIVLTVTGLLGMSYAPNFIVLVLCGIPLGLGAGAIDAGLNNYVALHYKALHMNWLHSFWGVGATISPLIISTFLTDLNGWRQGALVLAIIQAIIFLLSLLTLPLWQKCSKIFLEREHHEKEEESKADITILQTFRIRGIVFALVAFFAYICVESLSGMWFSSMLVFGLGVDEKTASSYGSIFYLGITIGRFISGIISLKVNEKNMIRIGDGIIIVGIILLMMNFYIPLMPVAISLIGLGCAPCYPAIIKETPLRFTEKYSQNVMGLQMSFAYLGNLVVAPLFGLVAENTTFLILPYVTIFFALILISGNEIVNFKVKKNPSDVLNLEKVKN